LTSKDFLEIKKSTLKRKIDLAEEYLETTDPSRTMTDQNIRDIISLTRLICNGDLKIVED
jgi:hypothetical protein